VTLLKGFLPIDGKRVGKIIWVCALCFACLFIWFKLVEPRTHQDIVTQIVNQCPEDTKIIGLRFNVWRLKLQLGL
jgi:hypothetical protein